MTGSKSWTWRTGSGLNSSATMMFGHVETIEDRIEHLERLRAQQDKSLSYANEPLTRPSATSPHRWREGRR